CVAGHMPDGKVPDLFKNLVDSKDDGEPKMGIVSLDSRMVILPSMHNPTLFKNSASDHESTSLTRRGFFFLYSCRANAIAAGSRSAIVAFSQM
ncbi:MAG: hypothetical protein NTW33_00425, partial [Methanoregula sp.]|nr:hypothetical protein [Methanoregula sp.]